MKRNKVIQFNYSNLTKENNILEYSRLASFDLKSIPHSKMKNYVTNFLCMTEELSSAEKYIFYFLYDLKSQQRYLP
jgi:hypothetical protein